MIALLLIVFLISLLLSMLFLIAVGFTFIDYNYDEVDEVRIKTLLICLTLTSVFWTVFYYLNMVT